MLSYSTILTTGFAFHFRDVSVLTWCLYHYSKHPDVRTTINAELKEAFPNNEPIQEEDLKKLPLVNINVNTRS